MRMRRSGAAVAAVLLLLSTPGMTTAVGESACVPSAHSLAYFAYTQPGAWERGTRATIEGQALPLCGFTGTFYPSGSFHWTALGYSDPNWYDQGQSVNVIQLGYGRCQYTNNDSGQGTLCNGAYYWYWAWGSYCGGALGGTGTFGGPLPIRIGAPLASPPPSNDFYVLRRVVNGVARYEGYAGGQLLTGVNALGQVVSASVPASSICWDGADQGNYRAEWWFGETFNTGDSMGGWIGSTKNHLDYTVMRYSVNTGWLSPVLSYPLPCQSTAGMYACAISGSDRFYIDTSSSR